LSIRTLKTPIQLHSLFDQYLAGGCFHSDPLDGLFDAIDPSPFRDRVLDPKAEEFIVGWAKDLPRDAALALVVDLDRETGLPDEAAVLRDAMDE